MKTIVVLTGAGMSAESGIRTFRDNDGLWHNYRVEEVATPQAWERNPELVLNFYNERRKQVIEAEPNSGHKALVNLEKQYQVKIITQNVDDLHERAGSSFVYHLHGEIRKSRSTKDSSLIFPIDGWQLNWGDLCPLGSQLRPHIVWFGENVPAFEGAVEIAKEADIFIIIGTSLSVYPAASLLHYAADDIPKYYIDPQAAPVNNVRGLTVIKEKAGAGLPPLVEKLLTTDGKA